jgi:hypothetical protein
MSRFRRALPWGVGALEARPRDHLSALLRYSYNKSDVGYCTNVSCCVRFSPRLRSCWSDVSANSQQAAGAAHRDSGRPAQISSSIASLAEHERISRVEYFGSPHSQSSCRRSSRCFECQEGRPAGRCMPSYLPVIAVHGCTVFRADHAQAPIKVPARSGTAHFTKRWHDCLKWMTA